MLIPMMGKRAGQYRIEELCAEQNMTVGTLQWVTEESLTYTTAWGIDADDINGLES